MNEKFAVYIANSNATDTKDLCFATNLATFGF
jgi:hypothetical protein